MVLVGILVLPFVSIAVFGYWLRRRSDVTLEMGTKCWDTFIKLISAFTVIVSGAMLFGKYIDQQEAMQVARQKEVARELSLREAEFL
jgi:membrane-bound ClpP family serine protease